MTMKPCNPDWTAVCHFCAQGSRSPASIRSGRSRLHKGPVCNDMHYTHFFPSGSCQALQEKYDIGIKHAAWICTVIRGTDWEDDCCVVWVQIVILKKSQSPPPPPPQTQIIIKKQSQSPPPPPPQQVIVKKQSASESPSPPPPSTVQQVHLLPLITVSFSRLSVSNSYESAIALQMCNAPHHTNFEGMYLDQPQPGQHQVVVGQVQA